MPVGPTGGVQLPPHFGAAVPALTGSVGSLRWPVLRPPTPTPTAKCPPCTARCICAQGLVLQPTSANGIPRSLCSARLCMGV